MNGKNRHLQYRRPLRRRRARFPMILAIVGGVLLVLLTVLLIIGGRMYKKSQAFRQTLPSETTEVEPPTSLQTPSILAYPLSAPTEDALRTLTESGATAASVALNTKNGASLCNADTLSLLSGYAKEQGVYLSGVYYLTALEEPDDLQRFSAFSESCVTLSAALRAGLSEVVLIAPASLSEAHTAELLRFADDLRTLVPEAVIGLALPHGFLTDERAATIDTLAKSFSLLATDLTLASEVNAALDADLYHLLRYSMRVLLPSREDNEAQIAAVQSHGIGNIQILP